MNRITTTLITLLSGMIAASLLITHTDNWKWYMSALLVTLAIRLNFQDKKSNS